MKSTMSAIALAVAAAAAGYAAPAMAQRAPTQTQARPQAQAQPQAEPQITPSKGAHKAILALQQAVNANDAANIPARVAEAQAVATTAEDRFLIASLRYRAARAANDDAAKAAAIEAILASGGAQPDQLESFYGQLANAYLATGQKAKAVPALERLIALDPADPEPVLILSTIHSEQGQDAQALALLQKQIAAAPGKADERLYRHAVQAAYNAKLPVATELSRQWVAAYPTSENWGNALAIYRNLHRPKEAVLIDALRLARAVDALQARDYHPYAFTAIQERAPAEAKEVVEEGIAAGTIDGNEQLFRDILAEATSKSAGQLDRLPALTEDALASPTANMAVTAGNIHYGYGNYAEAAELYRAALDKQGADRDLLNLRIGMSLARAGDAAGATAALNAVGGERAELAKYWLAYLQSRG